MRAVGAVVGALTVVTVGLAPGAAASDEQSKQWYLSPMQAEQMWKVSTGKGVKIALIDSGVNANTPSLKGQVLTDEVPKAVAYHATVDYAGHGTSMAELIAGTGAGGGLKGLAPGAKIVPYRTNLEGIKGAKEEAKTPEPAQALRAAADTDAKIISFSFGGMGSDEDEAAVKYALSKGKLLIAAVGNDGKNSQADYPASYPYVIGVASVDKTLTASSFSSGGGYADLAAPGEGYPGYCDGGTVRYCDNRQGTSPATALTSAAAALIWSAHPDWTLYQVERALLDTAGRTWPKDKPSKYLGFGVIRPRVVLADKNYDPGPANVDPLQKQDGHEWASVAPVAPKAAPSSSASATSQPQQKGSTGATSAAGSSAGSSNGGSSNTTWIALGAAGAVVVIGGGAWALARARRAR
ncbi:S8 family serine peptidase [Streptomyces griseochromogenes]|uniref:S8 family serine peptidase n=1 Tax=Streptomyces griseochromogenes TaxID=68214 RepID=UPI0027E24C36|nr:S8 family serine peptidase [Streptomyces griseochromogenes]